MMNDNRSQSRRGYGQGYRDYDEGRFTTGSRHQGGHRYSGDRNETSWDFDRENRGESSRNYRGGARSGYQDSYQGGNYQQGGGYSGTGYRGTGDDFPRDQSQSYYTGRYASNRDQEEYVADDDQGRYNDDDRAYYGSGQESGRVYGDDRYTRHDRDEGGRIGARHYAGSQRGGYRGSSDRY